MASSLPPETAALLAEESPGDNSPALSVSELSGALKRSVEDAFSHVRVRGEISGYKRVASGHSYLTLKDDHTKLVPELKVTATTPPAFLVMTQDDPMCTGWTSVQWMTVPSWIDVRSSTTMRP